MPIEYKEITDTSIIYTPLEQRYECLKKWEFTSEVEGARDGLVDLVLTKHELVYSEVDMDPLYGGGYPKRERIQTLNNYREFGPIHPFPEWLKQELKVMLM